jgi:hypothetical protein
MNELTKRNWYNFLFSLLFIATLALEISILSQVNGTLPSQIGGFEFILLSLAIFRLTRLFVYDGITQFLRDQFLIVTGETREKYAYGFKRCSSDVLSCPWCFSIWGGSILLFLYFLFPGVMFFVVLLLALSAVATFLQISTNLIGWQAEAKKIEVQDQGK